MLYGPNVIDLLPGCWHGPHRHSPMRGTQCCLLLLRSWALHRGTSWTRLSEGKSLPSSLMFSPSLLSGPLCSWVLWAYASIDGKRDRLTCMGQIILFIWLSIASSSTDTLWGLFYRIWISSRSATSWLAGPYGDIFSEFQEGKCMPLLPLWEWAFVTRERTWSQSNAALLNSSAKIKNRDRLFCQTLGSGLS